jgi:hypothetical protein
MEIDQVLWIRIRSDPKLLAGSESGKNHSGSESEQLRILNEFEVKLLWKLVNFYNYFSTKMLNLKI